MNGQRKRLDEERAATIRKIQEAAAKVHEDASDGAAGVGIGGGGGRGAGLPGGLDGGDMSVIEATMGRGRGRGLSNLPAWMTKAKGPSAAGAAAPSAALPSPGTLSVRSWNCLIGRSGAFSSRCGQHVSG